MSEAAFIRMLKKVHEMGEAGIPFSQVLELMKVAKQSR